MARSRRSLAVAPRSLTGLIGATSVTAVVALTAGACAHEGSDREGPEGGKRHATAPTAPKGGKPHINRFPADSGKRAAAALAGIPDGVERRDAVDWTLGVDDGRLRSRAA